jgi:hypothetical protein
MTDELPTTLEGCHELIRLLREENTHLRQAGALFGQLAERLNHELRVERSVYSDAGLLREQDGNGAAGAHVPGWRSS